MTEPTPMKPAEKAAAIIDAFNKAGEPQSFMTSGGRVRIIDVKQGDVAHSVSIRVGGPGTDDIVIVNPPVYRPDPQGEVVVNDRPYTYDPLGAAAEVIGMHVGAI